MAYGISTRDAGRALSANGWLKYVMSGSQSIAGYSYDAAGNRDTVSYGNGTSTVYAYRSGDPRYFIDSITHKRGATVLATIGYPTRDAMGDPESMTDWTGTWTYDYDSNNRLSLASPPVPVPDQPAGGIYGYDWVGNRLNPPADPNQMVYNKADQLLTWPGMHTYSYYKDGSLNEEKDASGVTQRSYTYTDDGLLDYAYDGNNNVIGNFTWDADKNRVGMVMGGGTYSFVYDTTAGIPAVIEEDEGANSVYYFRKPSGELIARLKGTDWRWYHFDALGSTRLLTDSSGNLTDRYAYDAYGHLLSHTDPDPTDGVDMTDDNPYQYVGELGYYKHWQAPEFGLLQLGVRFYDAETARFGEGDPSPSRRSTYAYVGGSPTSYVDEDGYTRKRKPKPPQGRGHPDCKAGDNRAKPPKCPVGETAVFVTCYSDRSGHGAGWGNASVYCENERQAGPKCEKCKNAGGFHRALCPIGTKLEVPGYGSVTVATCGCGQHSGKQPQPNNWMDLWRSNCEDRDTCWVCVKLKPGCTEGGGSL